MIVDRAAQAMTEGAPRPGFTARVMSTILGRPRPGFTSRVMEGLDAPERRMLASRLRPALVAAGAIALATVAAVSWLPANPALPAAPDAPGLAAWPYERAAIGVPPLPYDRWAPVTPAARNAGPRFAARPPEAVATRAIVAEVRLDLRDPFRIEALPEARRIEFRPISPRAATVGPLAPPAALSIADLRFERKIP